MPAGVRACASNRGTMFVRKKRGARARPKPRKTRQSGSRAEAGRTCPPGLEQRHLDLIGLFLIAFGVYLVFVLFLGWEGGKVGYGVETGLDYLFGEVGARIFTVLMLLVGGVLLTGTSISSLCPRHRPRPAPRLPRRQGRGARRLYLHRRGACAEEKTLPTSRPAPAPPT